MVTRNFASLITCSLLLACSDDGGGDGSTDVVVWGEEYIEEGIPAAEFEDGWSVRYEKFLITLGDVTVDKSDGTRGGSIAGMTLFDLTAPGPHALGTIEGLGEGAWNDVSYSSLIADDAVTLHEGVDDADLELMVDGEFNVYAAGTAANGDQEKTFAWGFSEPVVYRTCVDVRDGQETSGIVVGEGTNETTQLTIHGDHLFYDDLTSPEAKLRFAVIASADTDDDGEVTLAELAEVQLSSLSSEQGPYGVGALDVNDMAAFVAAATTSLGHFNGEGHCSPQRP